MINKFDGDHRFLSNFYLVRIEYEGIVYPSTEHAYQAAKFLDKSIRENISRFEKPGKAKYYPRKNPDKIRPDWDKVKVSIMHDLLVKKFSIPFLRTMLYNTGEEPIVEGNTWHDNFWGNCTCEDCSGIYGENRLGRLLMIIRDRIE